MKYFNTRSALFLVAFSLMAASCQESGPITPSAPVDQWGVGGELVYDAYSVDATSGFWRTTPDSTVRYTLITDKQVVDGRTNVHMFASTSDTIMLARTSNNDAEMRLPRAELPIAAVPTIWAPLPVTSKRDTTFVRLDSTITFGGFNVVIRGNALSHYAGTEEFSAPGIDRMTTSRTDLRSSVTATALVINASYELEASVWLVPETSIVTRTDAKTEAVLPGSTEKMVSGRSLRLKQIVYPKKP